MIVIIQRYEQQYFAMEQQFVAMEQHCVAMEQQFVAITVGNNYCAIKNIAFLYFSTFLIAGSNESAR